MDNIERQEIEQEERSIDFGAIFAAMKKHKRLYKKWMLITFVASCIFVIGLPNKYKCEVMLAPELTTSGSRSSLSSLAATFGMKIGTGAMGNEALFPTLYPDLMNSVDFKTSLFTIPVHRIDTTLVMSYYDYMAYDQKKSWWGAAISYPFQLLAELILPEDTIDQHKVNPFMLTKEQTKVIEKIDKQVTCDVDQKTMVITIDVIDQDPLIAATIADSVKVRLQDFITDYRTKKARVDLEYNRKLYDEAKERYTKARQLYSNFSDANQDLVLQSVRSKLVDLENDMQLKYNAYTMVANQVTAAEAKVQEATPAFTTLQTATVPVEKAGPGRKKIVLVFLFLAFLIITAYVLHKENQLKPLLGL